MIDLTQNMRSFLAMIRHSEGTDKAPDPYRVCFGYEHTIMDLSNHPACTGEWLGERITVGKYAGELSTAAGAYQIIRPTWVSYKILLSLPDFSPDSQDQCAAGIVHHITGLLVDNGEIAAAISELHTQWASLPGGDSGQPEATMASLLDYYGQVGGAYA